MNNMNILHRLKDNHLTILHIFCALAVSFFFFFFLLGFLSVSRIIAYMLVRDLLMSWLYECVTCMFSSGNDVRLFFFIAQAEVVTAVLVVIAYSVA